MMMGNDDAETEDGDDDDDADAEGGDDDDFHCARQVPPHPISRSPPPASHPSSISQPTHNTQHLLRNTRV